MPQRFLVLHRRLPWRTSQDQHTQCDGHLVRREKGYHHAFQNQRHRVWTCLVYVCLYLRAHYQPERESFISFSKCKYTGIKEGEMKTISEKRKTDNGRGGGGCGCPQMLVYIKHQGCGPPLTTEPSRVQTKETSTAASILPCKGRKESPAERGPCQAPVPVCHSVFPWHSVCEAARSEDTFAAGGGTV